MTSHRPASAFTASDLASRLEANGLTWLGSFAPETGECLLPDRTAQPRIIAIVGNVGSAVWPFFDAARQKRPDLTLDRWTEETVSLIAADAGAEAVYPFKGPPYHPFIQWAKRTGNLFSSPIGLTIHPTFGLWIAFRAALLIDHLVTDQPVPARRPCDDCTDQPCLFTCPVGAFTEDGYDFETCLDRLATPINACRARGCLARIACPIGNEHRYEAAHAAFHMHELLKTHGKD